MSGRIRCVAGCRAAAAAIVLLGPSVAGAHAVVYPQQSTPGAYERYVLRVPCERDVPTTRVEITFPAGLRVLSFADVSGWQLEVVRDTAGEITGAVWTGTLPPERFVELPFVGVNPREQSRLVWTVAQTYGDGIRIEWAGAPGSDRPASVTEVGEVSEGNGRLALTLAVAALIIASIAAGLTILRRPRAAASAH